VSSPDSPKSYVIHTYGCQMNEHDSERISGLLEADGYQRVEDEASADVVVYNTCTIRENADNKLFGNLGRIKELKDLRPELKIMVGGCQAQKDQGLIQQKAGHVDVVFGTHNVHRAAELLKESYVRGPLMEIFAEAEAFPSALPVRRDNDWSAWVTIQIGCDNSCAFCIVPSVRGEESSRTFKELLHEVRTLAAAGTVEVTLLGQNVNSYGRDLALGFRDQHGSAESVDACGRLWAEDATPRARALFSDLLREVGAIEGIRRVRYTSPHPKDIRADTLAAMAEVPTVMPHLHFPLQSGSDVILREMRRGYTAASYLEKIVEARRAIDDLCVTSDIIVGFPGETERDFEDTLEVCAAAEFDSCYPFQFSPRPGTRAAEFTDRFISASVMSERFQRLNHVLERCATRKYEARVGRIEEVLCEGPSKTDPTMTSARTMQGKLVHFAYRGADGEQRALPGGTFAEVEIMKAAKHFLRAEFREITARPKHRTKIAVTAL
jgi:tRNA-2-methylthio-N6-dimethylallyladenosine synthase